MDKKYESHGTVETQTVEECAELIHILMKVNRFGWYNFHPDDRKREKTPNIDLVLNEIRDVEKKLKALRSKIKIIREVNKDGK